MRVGRVSVSSIISSSAPVHFRLLELTKVYKTVTARNETACKKRMSGLFQLSNQEDEGEIAPGIVLPYMMLAARLAEVKKVAVAAMDLVAYEVDNLTRTRK